MPISTTKASRRIRMNPEVRRDKIVEVAFDAVAISGFEGLRTRDVAQLAAINSATLHHYFPTKEDLIAAVATELVRRFRTQHAPRQTGLEHRGTAALAEQFADVIFYHQERPEMITVYRELLNRAPRDPLTVAILKRLHNAWRAGLVDMLDQAQREGAIRNDLDVKATADVILNLIRGFVATAGVPTSEINRVLGELERWLTRR
jgi:AcrR family transcriptional regulator